MNKDDWLGFVTTWRRPKDEMWDGGVQASPTTWESTPKYHWEPWFAWYPVKVHGKHKWMTKVWRRVNIFREDMEIYASYEYGNIFDVIRDGE